MYIFNWVLRDTTSPNGKFYCTIKEPICLNPAAFGSPIAFYDVDGTLLYYNSNATAHELNSPADIERAHAIMLSGIQGESRDTRLRMVAWSKQGNMVHILEHYKKESQYYRVFINLKDSYQIWTRSYDYKREHMDILRPDTINTLGVCATGFDENEVLAKLNELGLDKKPLTKDKIQSRTLFQLIFGKGKWYK